MSDVPIRQLVNGKNLAIQGAPQCITVRMSDGRNGNPGVKRCAGKRGRV